MTNKPLLKFELIIERKQNELNFFTLGNNYAVREGIGKKNWELTIQSIKDYIDSIKEEKNSLFVTKIINGNEYFQFKCLIYMPFSSKHRKVNVYCVPGGEE